MHGAPRDLRFGEKGASLLLALLIVFSSLAAQWSGALLLPVVAGDLFAPGGVISGLALWIDAGESATQSWTPRIRFWVDKAGHGHHLTATPSVLAPYPTVVSLKKQAVFEDGALVLALPISLEPISAAIVLRNGSDTGYLPLLGRIDRETGIVVDAKKIRLVSSGVSATSGTIGSVLSSAIIFIRTNVGGADYVSLNGGTESALSWASSETATHVGAIWSPTGIRYLRASILEIAIWDRALTVAEKTSAIRALGGKWGISVP
jgi:hypothetical protein